MFFRGIIKGTFLDKHTKSPLRQWIKNRLVNMTGNYSTQYLLEEIVQTIHMLQGLGSGTEVHSSGERILFHVLKQCVMPPYCIIDVGANRGQFLQLALDNLSEFETFVHCFEPAAETFKCLHDSYSDYDRIILNNCGIAKEKGIATLYYDDPCSGFASLTNRKLDHHGIQFNSSEAITITTIDDYCFENSINYISLLKIDIEGHEFDALNGTRKMFENNAVGIVSFEFGGCNVDTRTFFQDFWCFFDKYNMKLFRITPSGFLYPIESYNEIHERMKIANFMAVSPVLKYPL